MKIGAHISVGLHHSIHSGQGDSFSLSVGALLLQGLALSFLGLLLSLSSLFSFVGLSSLSFDHFECFFKPLVVCGLNEGDLQLRGCVGLDLRDGTVAPLDHAVGNLDDFRVAKATATTQVDLVVLLEQLLQHVDVGADGLLSDDHLVLTRWRVSFLTTGLLAGVLGCSFTRSLRLASIILLAALWLCLCGFDFNDDVLRLERLGLTDNLFTHALLVDVSFN